MFLYFPDLTVKGNTLSGDINGLPFELTELN
jgi:hypothetical protein